MLAAKPTPAHQNIHWERARLFPLRISMHSPRRTAVDLTQNVNFQGRGDQSASRPSSARPLWRAFTPAPHYDPGHSLPADWRICPGHTLFCRASSGKRRHMPDSGEHHHRRKRHLVRVKQAAASTAAGSIQVTALSDYSRCVLSLKVRMVMSAIMRRRRSRIDLSRIEGSCPAVGVLDLSILRTGPLPS